MKRVRRMLPGACRLLPAACCVATVAMILVLHLPAAAQCTTGDCPTLAGPHAAVVRVANLAADGNRYYGSGTLVHKDAKQAVVLTCAHLFRRGVGRVTVVFPDGRRFEAGVLAVDRAWDLAALKIDPPQAAPVTIAAEHPRPGDRLQSCGYGCDGRYGCSHGQALGYAKTAATGTYETLQWTGTARDGDSGGPVFNGRGELVAVLWGTDGRTVGGTYCGRIRRFLADLFSLGRLSGPQPDRAPIAPNPPPPGVASPPVSSDHLETIRKRLDGLVGQLENTQRQQEERGRAGDQRFEKIEHAVALIAGLKDRIEAAETTVGKENLRAVVREVATGIIVDRAPGLMEAVLPAALAALGWTGPPSIAAMLAIRLIAGLLKRRVRKRRRRASNDSRRRPTPSKPWNDRYAEQLAGVYALSGRSPIADATLGREYDEELRRAERSSDGPLARWARQLRQRVAKRFYRIHGESPLPAEPPEQRGGERDEG